MSEMMQEFPIGGICCGNGIVSAQKTIKAVAGVTGVRIDLARNVAQVRGDFDTGAVITALHAAGYSAGPMAHTTGRNKEPSR
jgi:copper chaperone CopZ